MRPPVVCCLLCLLFGCANLLGIHDYPPANDAIGPIDAGSGPCLCGLSAGGVCPSSLAAGVGQTCAIAPAGLWCWGQNVPGADADVDTPALVAGQPPGARVALSSSADRFGDLDGTGCVLGSDLSCWGNSAYGQIQAHGLITHLMAMEFDGSVVAFAVGGDSVCASSGSGVACWGADNVDQLGAMGSGSACGSGSVVCDPGGIVTSTRPVETIAVMAAGQSDTCVSAASTADNAGGVVCWGANDQNQLGRAQSGSGSAGQVESGSTAVLKSAQALALGRAHGCAIAEDMGTYCWGSNGDGQLGIGSNKNTIFAHEIGTRYTAIAAGGDTTCAIDFDANVWCWGDNTAGAAGSDLATSVLLEPVQTTVTSATAIAVGAGHACALLVDGNIMCWGANTHGELGDGVMDHGYGSACGSGDCSPPVIVRTAGS